jgi:spore coat protein A
MVTRRQFLKSSLIAGAGAVLPWSLSWQGAVQRAFAAYVANNTLDPATITKYAAPMVIPPEMPGKFNKNKKKYKIAVRQFGQQILPSPQYGPTTVWSYGSIDHPGTVGQGGSFNYPAFTIEAEWNKDVQVQWRNELVDAMGLPLPHLLAVDPTLHWANPIGARDTRPDPADAAYWAHPYLNGVNGSYTGPVPMVTHVHGAHTLEDSDGYPEAWYLPAQAAADPNIVSATGTYFDLFNAKYGNGWTPGTVSFKYPNNQRATTLWYHDHTLGMTRLNVYAGPAGFYLIRGGPDDLQSAGLPGPAPKIGDAPGMTYYEIPIVIQDRSFDNDGQLWYPYYRAFFEGLGDVPEPLQIRFTPDQALNGVYSDVAPIWQPEFFGNVMVVNGVSWPFQQVEQQQYRFRLLNGCNSRFLILDFSAIPGVQVWQIGADGGFLAAPVDVTNTRGNQILMGPAERADVIVDFRNVAVGSYVLGNLGPDEPFGGDPVDGDGDMPEMREVMRFNVVERAAGSPGLSAFTEPDSLVLPQVMPLTPTAPVRKVSLNEEMSHAVFVPFDAVADEFVLDTNGTLWEVPSGATPTLNGVTGLYEYAGLPGVTWDRDWAADAFGPTAALLGDITGGINTARLWMEPVTENPTAGSVEEWEIHNFTVDAHPIHIHLVQFQIVGRFEADGTTPISDPEPGETGFKDTVIAYPGQVTKVRASFDTPGRFVWHCHIVEHEDNEMMRPYDVV